jgi:hypothetical protein
VRLGSYRAAAVVCGVDPKTVSERCSPTRQAYWMINASSGRRWRRTDGVRPVVLDLVREANGRGTAKRLLPAAPAAGYAGSDRNFRHLVAGVKRVVRGEIGRHQRRPAVWVPAETVVIDWGLLPSGLKVFCAVLAWSRVRFVRVARDDRGDHDVDVRGVLRGTRWCAGEGPRGSDGMLEGRHGRECGDPDTGLRPVRDAHPSLPTTPRCGPGCRVPQRLPQPTIARPDLGWRRRTAPRCDA